MSVKEPTREERRRDRKLTRGFVVLLAPIALLLAVGIAFAAVQFSSTQPFRVYDSKIVQKETCPLMYLDVLVDSEIKAGYDIRSIEITSTWEPVNGSGSPATGGTVTIEDPPPAPRGWRKSPLTRVAPDTPGRYRLGNRSETVYYEYGVPHFPIMEYPTDDTLVVLPESSPECRKGA